MPITGFEVFDESIQKTNILLKAIETELDWTHHRNWSYAALRSVLHVLRDRLAIQEAVKLAAQLPLLVKGIYYEGWEPSTVPQKIDKEEFIEGVRRQLPSSIDRDIREVISAVLRALRKYVSKGELEDVFSELPKDLSAMLKQLLAIPE